ncbi:MAG: hypothetical protein LUE27_06535 [Clostridia bacterium]|nr:hypothetical protein [Clostridia bacterium]
MDRAKVNRMAKKYLEVFKSKKFTDGAGVNFIDRITNDFWALGFVCDYFKSHTRSFSRT